jgi:hypothetical protein
MNLKKTGDTGIWRTKLWLTLYGELVLEETMDLSHDKISSE